MELRNVICVIEKIAIFTFLQSSFITSLPLHEVTSLQSINNEQWSSRLNHRRASQGPHYSIHAADDAESWTARVGQFPWMVMVDHVGLMSCGGTVISTRWVLTAGHCVVGSPSRFLLVFGDVDQRNIDGPNYYDGPGVSMITNQAILHPEYGQFVNDIALLYMPQDIPFGETIQPIKLAGRTYAHEAFDGLVGTIVGWGDTGVNRKNNDLLWGQLPIISNDQCSMAWANLGGGEICTASKTGTDACSGDSGGPLLIKSRIDGKYLQIGIVSYGEKECPASLPGVYTRVSAFAEWLTKVTGIQGVRWISPSPYYVAGEELSMVLTQANKSRLMVENTDGCARQAEVCEKSLPQYTSPSAVQSVVLKRSTGGMVGTTQSSSATEWWENRPVLQRVNVRMITAIDLLLKKLSVKIQVKET